MHSRLIRTQARLLSSMLFARPCRIMPCTARLRMLLRSHLIRISRARCLHHIRQIPQQTRCRTALAHIQCKHRTPLRPLPICTVLVSAAIRVTSRRHITVSHINNTDPRSKLSVPILCHLAEDITHSNHINSIFIRTFFTRSVGSTCYQPHRGFARSFGQL